MASSHPSNLSAHHMSATSLKLYLTNRLLLAAATVTTKSKSFSTNQQEVAAVNKQSPQTHCN